ncbi:MAG: sensor histidine kinase [Cyclobacteriaceae bacterium]
MRRLLDYKIDHIVFWTATVGFHGYTRIDIVDQVGLGAWVTEVVLRNLLLAGIIYANFLYLVPRFLQNKKHLSYLGFLLILLLGYVALKDFHDQYYYRVLLKDSLKSNWLSSSVYNFSIGLFYLAFSTALLLSRDWFVQRDELQKLRIENLNTELQYLRQQINPHFLFNTLNTIYFQISKENAEARETLHKFSEMLRYPLYECNGATVPLSKEVSYLSHYVDLQRLRRDSGYEVTFEHDVSEPDAQVYPLLMLPFVENAFKHGSHFDDKPNVVRISIVQRMQNLELEVVNTRPSGTPAGSGGIGLANTRRRLELLYQDRFHLDTRDENGVYHVKLRIPLA